VIETALYVDDLPRARDFYAGVLGCAPMLDTPRLVALAVAGRSVLLLFQRGATGEPLPTSGGVVPGHGGRGVQHLAFAVAADELPAWRRASPRPAWEWRAACGGSAAARACTCATPTATRSSW
jgi:catechol 2,3-dioxygenase-like lactoylglutathione lyase family enzyme